MQENRPVPKIDARSFHEGAVKNDRTGQPVVETQKYVPDGSQTRSFHESMSFNVGDKTLRERTERPVVDHDNLSHERNSTERGEHGFPNSRITTFRCEACAESIDTLFNN